jgi:hypothetical protein
MLPTLHGGVCLRGQSGLLSSQPQNSTSSSGGPFCSAHDDQGQLDGGAPSADGIYYRRVKQVPVHPAPGDAEEQAAVRPRDIAKQREQAITQNGRPEAVSGRLRRSALWGASVWGTEGREFKSRQPDQ